jgi:hypothetical protein
MADHDSSFVQVGSLSAFRLGISFSPEQGGSKEIYSPSLDETRSKANFTKVSSPGGFTGIQTTFGSLVADANGQFKLMDANGNLLVRSLGPPVLDPAQNGESKCLVKC